MAADNTGRPIPPVERTMEVPELPGETQRQVIQVRDSLRAVRETMSLEHFNHWVATELGMDQATAQDFLTFMPTDRLTLRMWDYFERIGRSTPNDAPPS